MRPKGSASEPRESVLRDRKSPDQTTQPPEEQAPPPQAGKTTKSLSIQPKTAPAPRPPATFIDRPGAAADLEKGEAESRKHQELLQLFVEHTPAAVAMFDREMRYVLVTDRWLINHKLSKEDVLGRWHYDVFPRVPERWKQIHQRVLAGGPAETCEEDCVQRADGSYWWLRWEVLPWGNLDRGPGGIIITVEDLTPRKIAENALRKTEELIRIATKAAEIGIWSWEVGSEELVWNDKVKAMFGFSPETKVTLQLLMGLIYPEDRELYRARMRRTLQENAELDIEYRVLRADGKLCWLQVKGKTVLDNLGKPARMAGVVLDITGRKRAEEALRKSEARFRRLYESNLMGILVGDTEGGVWDANDEFLRIVGYTRAELAAGELSWKKVTPPEDLKYSLGAIEQLQARGFADPYEKHYMRRDGTRVPVLVGIVKADPLESLPRELVAFVFDITERKRAEEEIRASEAKFRSLVENAPQGIYSCSLQGDLMSGNAALLNMLGYESDAELAAASAQIYSDPQQRAELVAEFAKGERFQGFELRWKRRDGKTILVRLGGHALRDASGSTSGFEVIAEDITERRMLEEQLRQIQRMESIGTLSGGIAHDFNNLLTIIKGYSRMVIDEERDANIRSQVEHIDEAADRAAALTSQLLAFSRRQVLQPKVFNLNVLVLNLDKMLQRLIGEHIAMVTVAAPDLGAVKADPGQIEQVVMNLAVNARDAMPKGGKLTLETANVDLDETYAREHVAVVPGRYVMLAVSDTGIGMNSEMQTRIFEPFFTTKEIGKGTGLGLSMVYGIVKQSGGNIWIYSELGRGTTFKIYLPRVDAPAAVIPAKQQPVVSIRGTETILLVEDDRRVRELAYAVLTACGYSVLVADTALAVNSICEQHVGPIHLLLTDVVMPGLGGREVAQQVTARKPGIRVLYMSGYTTNAIVHHGELDARTFFLPKPFTPYSLGSKVREVLDAPIG